MIVACGPESNGTRLLARLLGSTGRTVLHHSLPNNTEWWTTRKFPRDTTFVVITRNIDAAVESVLRAGHIEEPVPDKRAAAYEEQRRARDYLASIPGAVHITYEDLVADPWGTTNYLSNELGLAVEVGEDIYDGNQKYASVV